MPLYQFRHLSTGEVSEVTMTISEYSDLAKDEEFTAEWERFYSPTSIPSIVGQTGETCDRAMKACPQFRDAIERIKHNHPYNQIDAQLGGSVKKYDSAATTLKKMIDKAKSR